MSHLPSSSRPSDLDGQIKIIEIRIERAEEEVRSERKAVEEERQAARAATGRPQELVLESISKRQDGITEMQKTITEMVRNLGRMQDRLAEMEAEKRGPPRGNSEVVDMVTKTHALLQTLVDTKVNAVSAANEAPVVYMDAFTEVAQLNPATMLTDEMQESLRFFPNLRETVRGALAKFTTECEHRPETSSNTTTMTVNNVAVLTTVRSAARELYRAILEPLDLASSLRASDHGVGGEVRVTMTHAVRVGATVLSRRRAFLDKAVVIKGRVAGIGEDKGWDHFAEDGLSNRGQFAANSLATAQHNVARDHVGPVAQLVMSGRSLMGVWCEGPNGLIMRTDPIEICAEQGVRVSAQFTKGETSERKDLHHFEATENAVNVVLWWLMHLADKAAVLGALNEVPLSDAKSVSSGSNREGRDQQSESGSDGSRPGALNNERSRGKTTVRGNTAGEGNTTGGGKTKSGGMAAGVVQTAGEMKENDGIVDGDETMPGSSSTPPAKEAADTTRATIEFLPGFPILKPLTLQEKMDTFFG